MSSVSSDSVTIDWHAELSEQLDWHWRHHVRRRLDGLTDDEYLWEPVPGCWTIHPAGDGTFTYDHADLEPQPAPFTTIAWRLAHLVEVLGERSSNHFGDGSFNIRTVPWTGTAEGGITLLDQAYADWQAGVQGLGPQGLARPCGPAEGPFADTPMAALVLHINREVIHHSAEVLVLRDLYRTRGG